MHADRAPHYAARCRFLRMSMGMAAGGQLVNICQHIVRDGSLCVGPFLEDSETACGLWEANSEMSRFLAGTDPQLRKLPPAP